MDILEKLAIRPILVLDGAIGTELEQSVTLDPDLWSAGCLLDQPELIKTLHLKYLEAGVDILTIASYQATLPGLMKKGFTRENAVDLLKKSVDLAEEAIRDYLTVNPHLQQRPLIAASIGSFGAYLANGSEYNGSYEDKCDRILEFHKSRIEILHASEVDIFGFETFPALFELKEVMPWFSLFSQKPTWVSLSCQDAYTTWHGDRVVDCLDFLNRFDCIQAVGINCVKPTIVSDFLRLARQRTNKAIIVYPNSGSDWDGSAKTWSSHHGKLESRLVNEWLEAGANIIGGCCHIGPEQIKNLADQIHSLKR